MKTTKTILAVNPSWATAFEREFWRNFAEATHDAGWSFVQIAARSIPQVENGTTITVPARLAQLAEAHHLLPREELTAPPHWLPEADVLRHVEWERRRFGEVAAHPHIIDGALRLAWLAEHTIDRLRPGVVLTMNRIDHPCAFFRTAAMERGIEVGIVERSPIGSYWHEPDGLFAESELWGAADAVRGASPDPSIREHLIERPAGFRRSEASENRPPLRGLPRPIVFLPFDNLLWTGWAQRNHPIGAIDNPVFESPQEALDVLASWVGSKGGSLVVKAHPSCPETARLGLAPNTYLVEGALDHLIASSDLVVAFNTKVAFIALAFGRTTVTLSDNPAAATGLTVHWRDHPSPGAALDEAASRGPRSVDTEGLDRYFSWLRSEYFYSSGENERRGPAALVRRVIESSSAAASAQATDLEHVRDLAAGVGGLPTSRPRVVVHTSAPAARLLLDVSRLADPGAVHSGIARYGREILKRLVTIAELDVWALIREPLRGWSPCAADSLRYLQGQTNGRVLVCSASEPFASAAAKLPPFDGPCILHSIHLPLPPVAETEGFHRAITVHDVLHLIRPELHPGSGPPAISKVLDSIDVSADTVFCDSEHTRRDLMTLLEIDGERAVTIPLGVDVPILREGTRDDYVVALLQREPRKNASAIIEAVSMVLRSSEATSFLALISPGAQQQFREAVAFSGLDGERIRWLADPSDDELNRALGRARAFVFGSSYEGFGLPVLEAMAQGCPVVTPFNTSLVEVAGDAAAYSVSEDASDLADALAPVLADDAYASELSRRGLLRASILSWDVTVARLVQSYSGMAGR